MPSWPIINIFLIFVISAKSLFKLRHMKLICLHDKTTPYKYVLQIIMNAYQ